MKTVEELAREAGLMRPQMIGPELERFAALIREAVVQELVAGSGEPVAFMYEGEPYFDGNKWHTTYQLTQSKVVAEFNSGTIKKPTQLFTRDQLAGAVARERERNARLCESFNSEPMSHASVAAAIRGQT